MWLLLPSLIPFSNSHEHKKVPILEAVAAAGAAPEAATVPAEVPVPSRSK